MTADTERALSLLKGHAVVFCRGEEISVSDARGVAPLLERLSGDFTAFSVADKVVGKAAAMLFVALGVKEVYAKTLSVRGEEVLKKYKIPYAYGEKVERIINREGTDTCPMEKAVWDEENLEQGISAIKKKYAELTERV